MKNRSMIAVAVMLVVAIALFMYAMARILTAGSGEKGSVADPARADIVMSKGAPAPLPEKDVGPQEAPWGRDPFARMPGGERIRLTGILFNKEASRAIINGQMASVGDRIDNYTVMKIKRESVVVNNGSEDLEIRISK